MVRIIIFRIRWRTSFWWRISEAFGEKSSHDSVRYLSDSEMYPFRILKQIRLRIQWRITSGFREETFRFCAEYLDYRGELVQESKEYHWYLMSRISQYSKQTRSVFLEKFLFFSMRKATNVWRIPFIFSMMNCVKLLLFCFVTIPCYFALLP